VGGSGLGYGQSAVFGLTVRWDTPGMGGSCARLVVVLVLLVAACGTAEKPKAVTTQAKPTTTMPTTATVKKRAPTTDLEPVCKGEKFPSGAAYGGPPPHPTQAHGFGTLYGEYDAWPDPWPTWKPEVVDSGLVQLVLCEERLDPEVTDLVCHYEPQYDDSGPARTLTVELDVKALRLLEVRTGKLVTEARVTGVRECPDTAVVNEGEETVTSFTEVAQYAEAMRSFVLG